MIGNIIVVLAVLVAAVVLLSKKLENSTTWKATAVSYTHLTLPTIYSV